jgi:hypothetical protein
MLPPPPSVSLPASPEHAANGIALIVPNATTQSESCWYCFIEFSGPCSDLSLAQCGANSFSAHSNFPGKFQQTDAPAPKME